MKCTRCDNECEILECRDCSEEVWTPEYGGNETDGRQAELEDVLEFLKQVAVDYERCGRAASVEQLAKCLESGEHRR